MLLRSGFINSQKANLKFILTFLLSNDGIKRVPALIFNRIWHKKREFLTTFWWHFCIYFPLLVVAGRNDKRLRKLANDECDGWAEQWNEASSDNRNWEHRFIEPQSSLRVASSSDWISSRCRGGKSGENGEIDDRNKLSPVMCSRHIIKFVVKSFLLRPALPRSYPISIWRWVGDARI